MTAQPKQRARSRGRRRPGRGGTGAKGKAPPAAPAASAADEIAPEWFRKAFYRAPDAVFIHDRRGRFLEVNRQACEMLGYTRAELLALTVRDVTARFSSKSYEEVWRHAARRRQWVMQHAYRRKDGTALPVEITVALLRRGRRPLMIAMGRDIAASLEAQRALRESEQKYRELAENISDGVFVTDERGRLVFVNDVVLRRSGLPAGAFLGKRVPGEIGLAAGALFRQSIRTALRGRALIFELPIARPDGKAYSIEVNARPIRRDGRIVGVLGINRDVTERKQLERELRDSEARYRAVVEDQMELVCRFRPDTTLTFVNAAYFRAFGRRPEDLIGRTFLTLLPPADRRATLANIASVSRRRPVVVNTNRVLAGDRTVRWQEWVNRGIFDERGRLVELQGVGRDVTDRHNAMEEIRRLNEELERRVEERTAELRESEARYRGLLEHLPVGIYRLSSREPETVVFVNQTAAKCFGYRSPGDMAGMAVIDLHAIPADMRRLKRVLAEKGEFLRETIQFKRKDGAPFWGCMSGRMVRDEGGRARWIDGEIHDVTDAVKAQQALRRSEERLAHIIDNTWDIIFRIDLAGNYTFGNKAAERICGWPLARLLKMNMRELVAPEYLAETVGRLHQRVAGRTVPQPFVFQIINRAGRRVWLEMTTRPVLREGRLAGVQGIARDITARKNAEDAWRDSEARYRRLLDHLPVGVYRTALDRRGTVLMANPAAVATFGCKSFEELARVGSARTYCDARDRRRLIDELLRRGELAGHEIRLRRKDGTPFWARLSARLLRDEEGKPRWCDGQIRDITEQKQAEEALRTAQRRIMTAGEMERRQLAAEVHDSLSQQLVAAKMALRQTMAACDAGNIAEAHGLMGRAAEAVSRAIGEARAICYGLFPPALEAMGLCTAMRQLARLSGAAAAVRVRCPADVAAARFDPQVEIALYRIAQEALNNALRHGRARKVAIGLSRARGRLRLTVRDDGKGFDTAKVANHGLGLTTMRERATAVGGTLTVTSGRGGTVVKAEAPAAPRQSGPPLRTPTDRCHAHPGREANG